MAKPTQTDSTAEVVAENEIETPTKTTEENEAETSAETTPEEKKPQKETKSAPKKEEEEFATEEKDEMDDVPLFHRGRQPSQGRNWYAIHTYSGYEDSVKKALDQRVEALNMQDKIFEVLVPKEAEVQMRRGKPVEVKKCLFPGYVLVDMVVTDDSWYVVRNTPNVTGFVGSGNIPVPVSPEEFGIVKQHIGSAEPKFKSEFKVSDIVKITKGPFATFEGKVDSVSTEKGKLTVLVSVFDRETPVELDFDQVIKK